MLVQIFVHESSAGFFAEAPNLSGCCYRARRLDACLVGLRLAIEGHIVGELSQGRRIERRNVPKPVPDMARAYEMHINLRHLEALAVHQQTRPPAR